MKNCSDKFDRIAGTYLAQRHLFQMEDSLNQIVSLTGSLSGKDVTDLGCGGGKPVCDFFAANGARVTGIDYSPEMLREAKKNHPDISLSKWMFWTGIHSRSPATLSPVSTCFFVCLWMISIPY